jgi:hypothetical protein
MTAADIAARCRCGACRGPVALPVNVVALDRKARWPYPTAGNVLTGAGGEAVAVVCDRCVAARAAVAEAVEFRGEAVVYHDVAELEEIR